MSEVVWTRTALADIDRLFGVLEGEPEIRQDAIQRIRSAGDSLMRFPRRAPMVKAGIGLRKLRVPFGRYGYVIHFAILNEVVVILRVYHGRENRLV
jgi:plasmid stabilization system protein ParE